MASTSEIMPSTKPSLPHEVKWTDDCIRWPDDDKIAARSKPKDDDDKEEHESDDDEGALIDPFKDPDPFQIFDFSFDITESNDSNEDSNCSNNEENQRTQNDEKSQTITVQIRGYKPQSDEVWQSTGLTLWRASDYLCQYQVENSHLFYNKLVLELGAGLGLNGILAWKMMMKNAKSEIDVETKNNSNSPHVCITDGDSDALVHLRENIERNRPENETNNNCSVSCCQLIWGKQSSLTFLEHIANNTKYDVLIASDIIYALCIVEPLWETVTNLLKEDGIFVMAYARRKVPVSIEIVLESAKRNGFDYELVKSDEEEGIWVYLFKFC